MTTAKIAINMHRKQVQEFMTEVIGELWKRYLGHDRSKLEAPEFPIFERHYPRLMASEYGTAAYQEQLKLLREATDHHYAHNRHHPEHFQELGIEGMNLIDLLEMLCDWMAAVSYSPNGSIKKSIEFNKQRFAIGDQLTAIIKNTACWLKECAASAHRRNASYDQGGAHAEDPPKAS